MNNGSDNQGDDEASVDGSYTNQIDQGMNSDQDQSHSEETFSNNDNENDISERNDVEEGEDCMEETPTSNESIAHLFKLLPYLYLMQKNYGANGNLNTSTPGFELTNSQLCANSGDFSDPRNFRALLESEHFKNLQQLVPHGNGMNFNGANGDSEEDINCEEDSSEHDEPLDLTQKSKIISKTMREEKSIRPIQRTERGYTIQDLEAALQDIQSGKLGTRRAAVIYGIPRSTLRNKVYKLGKTGMPKSGACYNGNGGGQYDKTGGSDFSRSFNNNSNINSPNGEEFETNEDCNGDNILNNHNGGQKNLFRFIKDNPYSLLRNDNLTGNGVRMNELHNQSLLPREHGDVVGDRNQLLFIGGGGGGGGGGINRGHHNNQRGRHGSRPSLSLPNYPRGPSSGPSGYDNFSDSSSLGKKSRPKRGKYRNYDRDALAKAVQAVQNGEMSVHRAGSYFGVPHSTLEYKVKERHLLRQAKFKGKQAPPASATPSPSKSVGPVNNVNDQSTSYSSVTLLLSPPSPTTNMVDSNDSSNFQKTFPDMGKSLSQFMRAGGLLSSATGEDQNQNQNQSRWKSSLLGLGGLANASAIGEAEAEVEADADMDGDSDGDGDDDVGQDFRKEINAPLPKIYDPNETLENNPSDLLDLTRNSQQQQQKA